MFDKNEKAIEALGFDYNDVCPFLQMLSLSDHWFLVSKSVRQQYCAWRDGKIVIFGKYAKSSSDGGGSGVERFL